MQSRLNVSNRIPPMGTLRAFEAAARLGSFAAAASEVCVTQSAVSHRIRSLELALGQRLFLRKGPQVTLTPQGAFLAERVRLSLHHLADAMQAFSPQLAGVGTAGRARPLVEDRRAA